MDIPVYLLRNVCFFCDKGGLKLFIACFQDASPETLPMTLAHAMITVISNVSMGLFTFITACYFVVPIA